MKKIFSYLLLCIYAAFTIKPVMPTIADAFAHLLNYTDHVATVHHEHGEYHVHYEYQEAAKKSSAEKEPGNLKRDCAENEYLLLNEGDNFLSYILIQKKYFLSPSYLIAMGLSNDYPPPRM